MDQSRNDSRNTKVDAACEELYRSLYSHLSKLRWEHPGSKPGTIYRLSKREVFIKFTVIVNAVTLVPELESITFTNPDDMNNTLILPIKGLSFDLVKKLLTKISLHYVLR
jgi:hypothetical protein